MAFTYLGNLSTDLDKARFYIQDTVVDSGPKPSGGNFTDAELSALVTAEGTWQRAVAAALDALAAVWSQHSNLTVGPRSQAYSDVSKAYQERADQWRKEHHIYAGVKTAGVIRVDAYSDDVTSDDVDADTEYAKVKIKSWTYPL